MKMKIEENYIKIDIKKIDNIKDKLLQDIYQIKYYGESFFIFFTFSFIFFSIS